MANYDGEYELRLFYNTTVGSVAVEHRHTFDFIPTNPVEAEQDFVTILYIAKDGSSDNGLADWLDDYVEVLKPLFHTTTAFTRWEIWAYPGSSQDATYLSSLLQDANGTSSSPTVAAQQLTMTFRAIGGWMGRMQYMEHVIPSDAKDPYPFSSSAVQALATFLISPSSAVVSRANTPFSVPLNAGFGQNEKLWRKRFRSI